MKNLPSGTVTFLFTDIEGSTKLAQGYPDKWETLQQRHHAILQSAMEAHNGYVFQIIGDAFCTAFHTAKDGLLAALDAQRQLQLDNWGETPIRVRMGLHTGLAEIQGTDYRGYMTLAKVQRVMSVAYGGQVLVSNASAELIQNDLPNGIMLRDMKEHRLKGLLDLERLWQMIVDDLQQDFPPLQSLTEIPNNLPTQLTSFIGREKEVGQIKKRLEKNRLVTLTGSGGIGKTRLSIQVASELLSEYPNGTWLVELAPLTDPALVTRAVCTALSVIPQGNTPPLTALTDYLDTKKLLLVVDNCEHLIDACAALCDSLLHACPNLQIIASSRESLGIDGENAYRVPSLSLPDSKSGLHGIEESEAVKLFMERATAILPEFELTESNASFVAQICQRLDGIALAIELAASRLKILGVEQIASRLNDAFRLLTGGSRTALPRQQTLRALIDWSYNLLSEEERTALRQLSVFTDSWMLKAAESVCDNPNILDLLTHLVDKSLIAIDREHGDEPHYHLLETIRQYAREKLTESGDGAKVRDRHLHYYKKHIEKIELELLGPDQVVWLDRLDNELSDIRASVQWAKENQYTEILLKLMGSLRWYWQRRGSASEGIGYLQDAIAMTNAESFPNELAKALNSLGTLFYVKGDYTLSISAFKRAIEISRQQDNEEELACGLVWQCSSSMRLHKFDEARVSIHEGLELYKKTGHKWGQGISHFIQGRIELESGESITAGIYLQQSALDFQESGDIWGQALSLNSLGSLHLQMGKLDLAQTECEKSLRLREAMRDQWGINSCYLNLGDIARLQNRTAQEIFYYEKSCELGREMGLKGDMARAINCLGFAALRGNNVNKAKMHFSQSLKTYTEMKNSRGICECLAGCAGLAVAQGNIGNAIALLAATDAILKANGIKMWRVDQTDFEAHLATVRGSLQETEFTAAWNEGRAQSVDEAVAIAWKELGQ